MKPPRIYSDDVLKLMHLDVQVTVEPPKRWAARRWIAIRLIKLAGRVLGLGQTSVTFGMRH
jgi:hypothetical protein